MKNKKLTKSELTLKQMNKYKINIDNLNFDSLKAFKEKIKEISDSRQKAKCKYKIWNIVVVSFLAILGNCNDWEEIHDFAENKNLGLKTF